MLADVAAAQVVLHHITSISAWIARPALMRLQDADQVRGLRCRGVEAVDELLQRRRVFHQREFLASSEPTLVRGLVHHR